MPPPMPLSGAAVWYSCGSQPGSASSSAKRGSIASHASFGDEAPATTARTSATNLRTGTVSRTNSALIRAEHAILRSVEQRLTLLTLGVSDYERAKAFYEALGWSPALEVEETAFFQGNNPGFGLDDDRNIVLPGT